MPSLLSCVPPPLLPYNAVSKSHTLDELLLMTRHTEFACSPPQTSSPYPVHVTLHHDGGATP